MSDGFDFNKTMTLLLVEEKARLAGPPLAPLRNEAWLELMKIAAEVHKVQMERAVEEMKEKAEKEAEETRKRKEEEEEKSEPQVARRY
jgi:hypothetical protein